MGWAKRRPREESGGRNGTDLGTVTVRLEPGLCGFKFVRPGDLEEDRQC